MLRQWHIIDFLLKNSSYVSTNDICHYLHQNGIDGQLRTVQRDLKKLQSVFPLECRQDDKPYSWRWQRLKNTKKHELSVRQALILTMVELELKEFIPSDILDRLEPLLSQARYKVATQQLDPVLPQIVSPSTMDKKTRSFVPSLTYERLITALIKAQNFLKKRQQVKSRVVVDGNDVCLLKVCLINLELDEVARMFG